MYNMYRKDQIYLFCINPQYKTICFVYPMDEQDYKKHNYDLKHSSILPDGPLGPFGASHQIVFLVAILPLYTLLILTKYQTRDSQIPDYPSNTLRLDNIIKNV